jgi:hypothetical protein
MAQPAARAAARWAAPAQLFVMARIMDREFNTKGSLNYFRNLIPLFMVIGFVVGILPWYRSGNITAIFKFGAFGLAAGVIIYTIQWSLYGNVKYTITNTALIRKRGNRVTRSIPINSVKYYYFSKPEKFPRAKVRGEKDFVFSMTKGGVKEIVSTLESVGIKSSTNKDQLYSEKP